jgi:acyl transferase domain-containing protein
MIFSAKTAWSLMKYIEKMQALLRKNLAVEIADLAQSLQKVNHNLEHRAAVIASSTQDFAEKLNLLLQSKEGLIDSNIYISSGLAFDADATESFIIQQAIEKEDVKQLAQLWVAGATIDFRQLNENYETPRIDLPKYAFDHQVTFDFNNNHLLHNENKTVQFDDEFYQILLEKVSKGELSEEEFTAAIL